MRNTGLNTIQQVSPRCWGLSNAAGHSGSHTHLPGAGQDRLNASRDGGGCVPRLRHRFTPARSGQHLSSTDNLSPACLSIRRRNQPNGVHRRSPSTVGAEALSPQMPMEQPALTLPRPRGPSRPGRSPFSPSRPLTFLSLNSTSSPSYSPCWKREKGCSYHTRALSSNFHS